VFKKYFLFISSLLNYTATIQYRFPVFLTLPSHLVAAMYFIPFVKWGEVRHLSLKIERDAAKKLDERCCT
jgi:hypothetical protein